MFKRIKENALLKKLDLALKKVETSLVNESGDVSNGALFVYEILEIYDKVIKEKIPEVISKKRNLEFAQESTRLLKNTLTRKLLDKKLALNECFSINVILEPISHFIEENGGVDELAKYNRLFLHLFYFYNLIEICNDLEMNIIDGDNESLYRYSIKSYGDENLPENLRALKNSRLVSFLELQKITKLLTTFKNLKVRVHFGRGIAYYSDKDKPQIGIEIQDSYVDSYNTGIITNKLFEDKYETQFEYDYFRLLELNREKEVRFEQTQDYFKIEYDLQLQSTKTFEVPEEGKLFSSSIISFTTKHPERKKVFNQYFPGKTYSVPEFRIQFTNWVNQKISGGEFLDAFTIDQYSIKGLEFFIGKDSVLSYLEDFSEYGWPTYKLSDLKAYKPIEVETSSVMDNYLFIADEGVYKYYSVWPNGGIRHSVKGVASMEFIDSSYSDEPTEQYFLPLHNFEDDAKVTHELFDQNGDTISEVLGLINLERKTGVFSWIKMNEIKNSSSYSFITKSKLEQLCNTELFLNNDLLKSVGFEDLIAINTYINHEGIHELTDGFLEELDRIGLKEEYIVIEHDAKDAPDKYLIHSLNGDASLEPFESSYDFFELRDDFDRGYSELKVIRKATIEEYIKEGELTKKILEN